MATKKNVPVSADLEETAELPVLGGLPNDNVPTDDPLASTDAWVRPSVQSLEAAMADKGGEAKRAAPTKAKAELEQNLRGLTANLRELENVLSRKSEQLSLFEREVGQRDRRIADLDSQCTALSAERATISGERDALRGELAHKGEQLAALERELGQRNVRIGELETQYEARLSENALLSGERDQLKEEMARLAQKIAGLEQEGAQSFQRIVDLESLSAKLTSERTQLSGEREKLGEQIRQQLAQIATLEGELAQRAERIEELQTQGGALANQRTSLSTERDQLREQLQESQATAAAAQKLAESNNASASAWLAERNAEARRVRTLEAELEDTRLRSQRYHETLQSLESRRQLFDSMLSERDIALDGHAARLAAVQADAAARISASERAASDRVGSLERDAAERIGSAERAAGEVAQSAHQREQQLQADLAYEKDRAKQLDTDLRQQREAHALLRTQSDSAAHAAQARTQGLETEVGAQAQVIHELRQEIASARSALEQRNELIARLEAEAASSAAVLGSIQQNLEHLGEEEQYTRMLVRTEGETGIVHILGRRTSIGRTPDNDMRIDADFISRHHALIMVSGAKTMLEDLNSTNGSYVNGERVSRRVLKEGDLVTLGKSEFRFVVKPPPERNA